MFEYRNGSVHAESIPLGVKERGRAEAHFAFEHVLR
jgi:hypothetical protein